jgi:thiol-disulfide isomerase/thioredoxin
MIGTALVLALTATAPSPAGSWRAVLDLAGGQLRFSLQLRAAGRQLAGSICNGRVCTALSGVRVVGDSITLEIASYAATIRTVIRGDSITGVYHNVGNRGPRTIPFRASRGRWPIEPGPADLLGSWDATFITDGRASPRVFLFRNDSSGLTGGVITNTGDYGHFWGRAESDSFRLGHFDGSFVYMLTGRLDGDTLRGTFHAGQSTQTPFTAVRSTGAPHLRSPTEMTSADTTAPFRFAFPGMDGRVVANTDAQFRGKVVLLDVFGTWCPTCHEAAPMLVDLYRRYHGRGLEIVGLAYEVTGDSAVDAPLVRRFQQTHHIPYPLLLAGVSDAKAAGATLPQLTGFTAFPTSIFLGRDGRVRLVHAGFLGAATGPQHDRQVVEFRATIERLLAERVR